MEKKVALGGEQFGKESFQLILGKGLVLSAMRLKKISAITRRLDFEDGMPEGSDNGFDEDYGMPLKHFGDRIPMIPAPGFGQMGLETGVLPEQRVNPQFVAVDGRIKQSFPQFPEEGGQFRRG